MNDRVSAMAAAPMKREYGPSAARLLAPRWRAASRFARIAVIAAAVALVGLLLAVGLTLENAEYSHGAPLPFGFSYRDLYRVAPEPGGYVKVESRWRGGALKYSYAVDPLQLPPYSGGLSGELPIYAAAYVRALSRRYPDFALRGEGKTRISNTLTGYQVAYAATMEGQKLYARDVLLVPKRAGAREGVELLLRASPQADVQVDSPLEVGATGVLLRPLKTFSFG